MVGIYTMLRHPKIWRFCFLTAIALGAGSWFSLAIATPTFSQTPRIPAASTPTRSLLKTGSQGTEVIELQGILKLLGYYTGLVNGGYDQPTAIAVTKFQKAAGLPADGVVGLETWNRLLPPSPTVTSAAPIPTTTAASSRPSDSFPIPSGSQTKPQTPAKPPTASATPAKSAATKPPVSSESIAKQEPIALPILRIGMQGSAVTGLQERLRALGFLKSSADGVFGAETQAAVKAAQKKFSLASDGVVGAGTWLALMR
ncbi:MAG: peptidoglycan-binding protein [Leptolyngbyaceae cyanobacterium CAN_BIN12]|nr:peptidoglycan-binding protein [Leptolyngbyaceae cyanobacterium CAN_BIN12]